MNILVGDNNVELEKTPKNEKPQENRKNERPPSEKREDTKRCWEESWG